MTGATQMTESALKNARFRAADWLIGRVEAESWTPEMQAEFDAWLAESPANLLAFWRAEDSWKRAGLIGELYSPPTRSVRGNPTWRVMRKATGFVAVIVVVVSAIFLLRAPQVKTYSTPVGGQKTIALSDGSKIELNTDTELQFDLNNQRKVALLRGEAYFRIRHDSSHPFVVIAAGRRITDLGTEFSIRNDASRIEVALVKGRARVDQETGWIGTRSAILMPGDVAVATADTVSVVRKQIRELETALSWRQGLLVFHHTTLAEAAAQFNRYNREKLVIGDSSTAREEIRGTFRANDAAAFANMAKVVMGLQLENHGDEIVLSR
jgi:transmembrane sensor